MSINPVGNCADIITSIIGQVKTLDDLPPYNQVCKEWYKATGQELLRRCALIAQRLSICGKHHTLPDNCQEYVLRTTSETLSRFRKYDPFASLDFSLKMQYIEEAAFLHFCNRFIGETWMTLLEKQRSLLLEDATDLYFSNSINTIRRALLKQQNLPPQKSITCHHYQGYIAIISYMFASNLEQEARALLDALPEDTTVYQLAEVKCHAVSHLLDILVSQNRIKDATDLFNHYLAFKTTTPQLSPNLKKGCFVQQDPAWLKNSEMMSLI
jgi:hypothetical protein